MLPAHLQELLTAAVDGELTHAERRMVDTLLRTSEEAATLFARLQADAQKLRSAPAAAPAEDLASDIMAIINGRGLRPTPLPTQRRHSSAFSSSSQFLPWFSIATAAVVLIAVSVVSYLFFATERFRQAGPEQQSVVNVPNGQSRTDTNRQKPGDIKVNEPQVTERGPMPRLFVPTQVAKVEPRPELELLPDPRLSSPDHVIAVSPQPESLPFRTVPINLSLLLPLKDLDQPYPKKQLRDELKRDEIVRIDLFCKDSTKAAELLLAALRVRGQQTVVDSIAQDRLKKRLMTEYVFYTESLTPEEIAAFLEALGSDDRKAEEKKAGEGQFDKFLLAPFAMVDLNELAKLLGVRPGELKLPKPRAALDPRKSLESNTASQIAAVLPKGVSSRGDRLTLVLPNGPFANPQTSKEIKSFLERRGERKPGTVPLMLMLRILG